MNDAGRNFRFARVSRGTRLHLQKHVTQGGFAVALPAAHSPHPTPDLGRKLENAAALHLRRSGEAPAFFAAPNDWECDFVTPSLAIQCCARLTPENRQRELRGLLQASSLPGSRRNHAREPLVLTLDQEDQLQEQGAAIQVVPA